MVTSMEVKSSFYREGRDSIFLRIFGRSPQTRIIDMFLDNPFFDLSRMEMVEALGMAKITMYKTIPIIENSGMIVPSRKIGKTQLYRLNGDSAAVKHLRSVVRDISFKIAESELTSAEFETPAVEENELFLLAEKGKTLIASS